MDKIIIALLLLFGTPDNGWTSRYAPHVMQPQVEYHELIPPCPVCAIAVADCSEIGNTWLIRPHGTKTWTAVVVADCAGNDGTPQWMADNDIVLELSYGLAERLGAINSIQIEVKR